MEEHKQFYVQTVNSMILLSVTLRLERHLLSVEGIVSLISTLNLPDISSTKILTQNQQNTEQATSETSVIRH